MTVNTVTPQELNEKSQRGESVQLLDVRTPLVYQEVHIPFARNVPLGELDAAKMPWNQVSAECGNSG